LTLGASSGKDKDDSRFISCNISLKDMSVKNPIFGDIFASSASYKLGADGSLKLEGDVEQLLIYYNRFKENKGLPEKLRKELSLLVERLESGEFKK